METSVFTRRKIAAAIQGLEIVVKSPTDQKPKRAPSSFLCHLLSTPHDWPFRRCSHLQKRLIRIELRMEEASTARQKRWGAYATAFLSSTVAGALNGLETFAPISENHSVLHDHFSCRRENLLRLRLEEGLQRSIYRQRPVSKTPRLWHRGLWWTLKTFFLAKPLLLAQLDAARS